MHRLLTISIVAVLLTAALMTPARSQVQPKGMVVASDGGWFWEDAVDLGNGWRYFDWFGTFWVGYAPWIYHQQHEWIYAIGDDATGLWLWTYDMGWLLTFNTFYPWLYNYNRAVWLYYLRDSSDPRYFYNGETEEWENDGALFIITPYADEADMGPINEAYSESADAPWGFAHNGVDFFSVDQRTPFRAVSAGTVEELQLFYNEGNSMWQVNVSIRHDTDYRTGYAFEPWTTSQVEAEAQLADIPLSTDYRTGYAFEPWTTSQVEAEAQLADIPLSIGQYVTQGEIIGYLHKKGAGAHVHFGLYQGWSAICPEPFFTRAAAESVLRLLHMAFPGADMCYNDEGTLVKK
ncbi:MAG: M23 family metallopeptidase [Deltaproteobacteria bacterium]|nr:M23 family metallopeptidase [Deltaproteobacteria bacterium]